MLVRVLSVALTRLIRLSAMCSTDPAARFDAVAAEPVTRPGVSTILSLGFGNGSILIMFGIYFKIESISLFRLTFRQRQWEWYAWTR